MGQKKGIEAILSSKEGGETLAALYGRSEVEEARLRYARLADSYAETGPEQGGEGTELRFYSAPGRTELAGNHTDHNRGKVLCAAVSLDALACVRPRDDGWARLVSKGFAGEVEVDLSSLEARPEERGTTAALLRGVAAQLAARGIACGGFSARIDSRVLVGSGLSSSAAIELLFGVILTDLAGAKLAPMELARIGQAAENDYFGKPCGLMDQGASATGGIVSFDFRDPAEPLVVPLVFDLAKEGYRLVVVNTGGSHADLTEDYAAMPREMRAVAAFLGGRELRDIDPLELETRGPELRAALGDRAILRAFHFFDENERVTAMIEALRLGKFQRYLKLVRRSGDSSWRLLQNLHAGHDPASQGLCLAIALSERFLGKRGAVRVHGGGLAGTIQAYVPEDHEDEYRRYIEAWFGRGSVITLALRGPGACRVF